MIYTISHRTTFAYEKPVGFARCVLRLTPASSPTQTRLCANVRITPEPASRTAGRGAFGEATETIVIDTPHEELVIAASSRVDVHADLASAPANGPAWETVRTAAFAGRSLSAASPAAFLYPTRRTPATTAITDYARSSFAPGRDMVAAASELMTRMHADFTYDSEATTVSTSALQAFEARRGVCQDFAHILISGLKGLGLPAGYVSGYLRTNPPPGRPRLAGADATHAWVTLWCGDRCGWVGFDPTNAVLARADHIVLAVGRDYSDVAPIDGVLLAPGDQSLTVAVDVVPEDECIGGPERIPSAARSRHY